MSAVAVAAPPLPGQEAGGDLQILTFHLAGHLYGIPLTLVREITPLKELNKMPHMPRGVEGLLNLRGEVIPVINLRIRLDLPGEDAPASKILVLELASGVVGLHVDGVDSVLRVPSNRFTPPSPLLEGIEGAWIRGFVVLEDRIIALLDPLHAGSLHQGRAGAITVNEEVLHLERRLDEGLQNLIAMAPEKEPEGHGHVIPQVESAITFTEQEMAKVLDRVEGMLGHTDKMFRSLAFLKHEVGLGRLKGHEKEVVELEKLIHALQDTVFGLIQQIQFQDIARQKLERVMSHLRGLQKVVGGNLRASRKESEGGPA